MRACMGTGKPPIAILMAVYEPRMDWLKEQLVSLEGQSYPNLRLYIRDDCSPTVPFERIRDCVEECIRSFPHEIRRNERNLGSNKTFERLTEEAEGAYFAYCDQDDVWLPEKLGVLQKALEREGAELACSDVYIIDGNGKQVADSITKVRRRHVFASGEGLGEKLLMRNFVMGCTMLVRAGTARASRPFPKEMVHDHWLALYCAVNGRIQTVEQPLVRYRLHDSNQTRVLAGVRDREGYVQARIFPYLRRLEELQERLSLGRLEEAREWARARLAYSQGERAAGASMRRLAYLNPGTTWFELLMMRAPKPAFQLALRLLKKGIL